MNNPTNIIPKLIGLKVTRTWISVGSWLWIELGELRENGKYNTLHGDFTLEANGPWQIVRKEADGNEVLLIDSEMVSPVKDEGIFPILSNKQLESIDFSQEDGYFSVDIYFSENIIFQTWLEPEETFNIHSRDTVAILEYGSTGQFESE